MKIVPISDLQVIGFIGRAAARDVPQLFEPVYQRSGTHDVLCGPFQSHPRGLEAESVLSSAELSALGGDFTPLEPTMARADASIYIGPGTQVAEYISDTEAHRRLVEFSSIKRKLGDEAFRSGGTNEAWEFWLVTAEVSQSVEDYARLLLACDDDAYRQSLGRIIESLHANPTFEESRVRRALGSKAEAAPEQELKPGDSVDSPRTQHSLRSASRRRVVFAAALEHNAGPA